MRIHLNSSRRAGLVIALAAALLAGSTVSGIVRHAIGAPAATGTVFTPPAGIDRTGTTDVSDALSNWIGTSTSDGTAATPNVIDLDGIFRVEYGLAIGNISAHDISHPGLTVFARSHIILDLTDATLVQKDPTPFSNVNKVIIEPRKRYGAPVIKIVGGNDIRIIGGNLVSTNTLGHYSLAREPWHGVTVVGTLGLQLIGLHIQGVWGDFVYLNHNPTRRSSDVLIAGGLFERNGRQGITLNAVDTLEIRGVEFRNVQRMLFDHEPDARGGTTNVYIHDNFGDSGGLGYMNLRPLT